ncbi:MAG: glycine--tRNA ligase subunit beta [Burkholderiaceae bacterium]|jgi:glycyl-tRNA synthetase beta chain|nr:glycine--tRNA ligase subunit beta [Burkholderiaceae bacterium]
MKQSLLVELNTEELPPRALKSLSEAFAAGIAKGLRDRQFLSADSVVTSFGAPRRLAAHITHVLNRSPDKPFKQKLMPLSVARDAASSWTLAFLKKLEAMGRRHMADIPVGTQEGADCLVVESDGKADSVFLRAVEPGQTLIVALQSALDEAIASLPIPKVMSYQLEDGTTTVQFVRPAHRLIAMRGHEVLPVTALGLQAGTTTHGHRFMAPGDLPVHSADAYEKQLQEEGLIIASFTKRRARIAELVRATAADLGATPIMPDELLDEVAALVEWPVVYESGFEKEFLEVPAECLILTMQQNQKYFALRDKAGRLMNRFLLVSHIEATDGGAAIRAGNARVVRARLADAKFFFDQDRKESLESRIPGLAHVVYHNKLGSQLERVERITGIAVALARELGVDAAHVGRAARLAKADLRTLMVGEFPELQGVMGEVYARHDGETADVATAIREHYQPRFAGDALPATRVGLCVALADKLETLVGLFGIGEKPTGERDPFGLRRHALGVLRMLMEKSLPLPLPRMLALAQSEFAGVKGFKGADAELSEFLYDRLRGLLRDDGYTAHEVEAVVAQSPARIDIVPSQLAAVRAFMELPEAESLAAANKRIGNILKKADGVPASFDAALLMEPAERSLGDAFAAVQPSAERLYASGDYTGMLRALAPLKLPVDRFFDEVMVNVDDAQLRANRLGLLAALRATMNRVADISKLTA